MLYDMHCHALPGIDDGARDWDEALAIARAAIEAGVTDLVLTPHYMPGVYENTIERVLPLVDELCQRINHTFGSGFCEVGRAGGQSPEAKFRIYSGCEAYLCPELPDLAAAGKLQTINGSRYILVELPQAEVPPYAERVLFELQSAGFWPIIAHPERNRGLSENPEILVEWIRRGIPAQLNTGSLSGHYGSRAKKTAEQFIRRKMVHMVGSDCHRADNYWAVPNPVLTPVPPPGPGLAETTLAGRPVKLEDPGPPPKVSWWSRVTGVFRATCF